MQITLCKRLHPSCLVTILDIIYPDGYETDVASLRREKGNGDSAVYSLKGVRLGNVGFLPPCIYIQNGKKIIKGKRTKDQSP